MADEITKPFHYYRGSPQTPPPDKPVTVPSLVRDKEREAAAYIADERLVDAVNVALMLSQPLLVTGEPGSGKTQLAYSVGRELGYPVLKFEAKSTSIARDLFYTYDAFTRFQDIQSPLKGENDEYIRHKSNEYITFKALGLAILQTQELSKIKPWLPPGFKYDGPRRSVVLIDEIDKAPRDFPNDLLNEIEGMYFQIPELGLVSEKIEAKADLRPVVVITSNTEKNLPDPFLRRCIYYDIPFPDKTLLNDIVFSHMPSLGTNKPAWLEDAIGFFSKLREPARRLDKRPATAELLNWITYLRKAKLGDSTRLRAQPQVMIASLSTLFKSQSDQKEANKILKEWLEESPK
jgi:MoxR-like ATPase